MQICTCDQQMVYKLLSSRSFLLLNPCFADCKGFRNKKGS